MARHAHKYEAGICTLCGVTFDAVFADFSRRGHRAVATRRELEERVTVNIQPDHLPLWDRVKRTIKGTPQERLEAFEAYVHNHPTEVLAAVEAEAEAKLEAMLSQRAAADAFVSTEVPF